MISTRALERGRHAASDTLPAIAPLREGVGTDGVNCVAGNEGAVGITRVVSLQPTAAATVKTRIAVDLLKFTTLSSYLGSEKGSWNLQARKANVRD